MLKSSSLLSSNLPCINAIGRIKRCYSLSCVSTTTITANLNYLHDSRCSNIWCLSEEIYDPGPKYIRRYRSCCYQNDQQLDNNGNNASILTPRNYKYHHHLPSSLYSYYSLSQQKRHKTSSSMTITTTEEPISEEKGSGGDNDMIDIPGAQKGGKKLAIVFTCTVCDTRSAKQFTEQAYMRGVVIVKCPGCNNQHLIADNLGYFKDKDENDGSGWNIEKALQKMGDNVQVVNDDNVLELSVEDIYGHDMIRAATEEAIINEK
mmetsp:Transcript_35313/g.38197  ORF Transcript_35313/g.38197 Transcript_35313/m.38197 type:complete len:262 (-) Transcript_35313:215-1000(-)